MSQDFMHKVQYLCRQIKEVEWSGILFYEFQGTMNKPDKAKIILKDIFLMDRGTKTLTEYDFDTDETSAFELIQLLQTNPKYKAYHRGLIHSHNTMNVFFSGTDIEELVRSSEFYNFYLSLIVNDYMEFTAKVAFRGKLASDSIKYSVRNEKGESYDIKNTKLVQEVMFTYDCNIVDPISVSETFSNRTKSIMDKSDKRDKERAKLQQKDTANLIQKGTTISPNWRNPNPINKTFADLGIELPVEIDEKYEDFTTFLLRLGNTQTNGTGKDDIEDAIEDCVITNVIKEMSGAILNNFIDLHEKFFSGNEPDSDTVEFMMNSIEQVIFVLEEYEEDYVWLTNIVLALKSFGNKLATVNN